MVTVSQRITRALCAVVLGQLGWVGCKPELEGRPSLVEADRILAIRSLPAEAKPKSAVSYEALYVSPDGELTGDALDWALCNRRKALTQSGTISKSCLFLEAPSLELLGTGSHVDATLPPDACETFGPTPRTPKPGEPNFRPVDPDTTGGFYQPVRVLGRSDEQLFASGMTRLACGLGGATQEQAADFNRRYRVNENPKLDGLVLVHSDGSEEPFQDAASSLEALSVQRAERVLLRASWADCPSEPSCGDGICSLGESDCPADCAAGAAHGCTGSEPYLSFDAIVRSLNERREAIRVSWFATGGRFDYERTGHAESDQPEASTENWWTAPVDSSEVLLWLVIRDDRGGVGWTSYRLRAE